jgi:hypothetical protein
MAHAQPREVGARRVEESQVQDSERALVPLGSGLAGPPPVSSGGIDMPWLLAPAVLGWAVEAQRRSLNAAGAVAGRLGWPLWVLASRRNASLQDLVVGTAVLYDWAYHPAEEPVAADDGHSPRPARSPKHA